MVAICHVSDMSSDSRSDKSAIEAMLECAEACQGIQSIKLLSQNALSKDFSLCQGIFRTELSASPLQSALTAAHVANLVTFGYTICDHFADDTAVDTVCKLANASLDLRDARLDKDAPAVDGVHWILPQPRNARKDVTTWLSEGHPLAAPLAAAFDLLEADLCAITHMRSKREMQLACYPGHGDGYKRHTDARPELDMQGSERKVTAIVYCNQHWSVEHGGALQLRLADHEGGGVLNVEPKGGRLLLFLSGCMMHEVLPSYHRRIAVTCWFR